MITLRKIICSLVVGVGLLLSGCSGMFAPSIHGDTVGVAPVVAVERTVLADDQDGSDVIIAGKPFKVSMTGKLCAVLCASPGLNFSFLSAALPPPIPFSRSTTGQDYNSSGLLASFAINAPRLGFDPVTVVRNGLLYEPASTNLLTNGNTIGGTGWSNDASVVVATNSVTSPTGASTATTLTDAASATTFRTRMGATVSSGATATCSWFMKNGTRQFSFIELSGSSGTNGVVAIADLAGGTITASGAGGTGVLSSSGIKAVGSAWYRVWVVGSIPANTAYNCFVGLWNSSSAPGTITNPTYTGNGSSIQIYGGDMEVMSAPTSYIPTSAGQVTRAADVATFTIPRGVGHLVYKFSDGTTQTVSVSPGSYTIPTNLNKPIIATIVSAQ